MVELKPAILEMLRLSQIEAFQSTNTNIGLHIELWDAEIFLNGSVSLSLYSIIAFYSMKLLKNKKIVE